MIEEQGKVVATEGDLVWVETCRQSACDSCASKAGCGHGALAKLGAKTVHMQALCEFDVAVGDQVVVGVPEQVLLRSSVLAYIMPLVTMMLAALLSEHWWQSDLVSGLAGVLGLAFGFLLLRWHFQKHRHDQYYQPMVLRRVYAEASHGRIAIR